MSKVLKDIVEFRGDRLFDGAVNLDWFSFDKAKTIQASESFVFHGPKYHAVKQEDIGISHGHSLIDTASFTKKIVHSCYDLHEKPTILAIAGYGTGKSHLAITLAQLLSSPNSETSKVILSNIEAADSDIGEDIRMRLNESPQPCLVVALNGTKRISLSAELTRQIVHRLNVDGLDAKALNELRPRFQQAANLVSMSNDSVISELLYQTGFDSLPVILEGLACQDENVYAKIYKFFQSRGMPITAFSGETITDIIDVVAKEYCGQGKYYRSLLILFDEFGKYIEFASSNSHIAGSGALQDLFEGLQSNSGSVTMVGFIQFELNAYLQRIEPDHKNEMIRYVTRFESAEKLYLSTNLETLIASLIDVKESSFSEEFSIEEAAKISDEKTLVNINKWFPVSTNYRIWSEGASFFPIIQNKCWPLSPYTTWFLCYLAAVGKHLQDRSALSLLGDYFHQNASKTLENITDWKVLPAMLWSESFEQELLSSEQSGQQGSMTHSYASVMAKHGAKLASTHVDLLRSIVIASKLELVASDRTDAITALAELSGLSYHEAFNGLHQLQEEYNTITWDQSYKSFEILGDAVSPREFLLFVQQKANSTYDEKSKGALFAKHAKQMNHSLEGLECDFADLNEISTKEWAYTSVTTSVDYLPSQIQVALDNWSSAHAVDEPKGTIIFTYVSHDQDLVATYSQSEEVLRKAAASRNYDSIPVIIVLLYDKEGQLGQHLAEYFVINELTDEEKLKYGNLASNQKHKLEKSINDYVDELTLPHHCYHPFLESDSCFSILPWGNSFQ